MPNRRVGQEVALGLLHPGTEAGLVVLEPPDVAGNQFVEGLRGAGGRVQATSSSRPLNAGNDARRNPLAQFGRVDADQAQHGNDLGIFLAGHVHDHAGKALPSRPVRQATRRALRRPFVEQGLVAAVLGQHVHEQATDAIGHVEAAGTPPQGVEKRAAAPACRP
jgi:hypothetical protein